eukprot:gene17306-19727_t
MNPLNIESISRKSAVSPELAAQLAGEEKFRKQTLDQKPIPMEKEEHLLDPWFYKCDDKIVKYDMRELGRWKALVSCWYTVLSDWDTWNHLTFLTIVCFFTMFMVIITGSTRSVYDNNSVVNKALTLVSFVFAGYVAIVINRWDRIRNATIGQMWGALENLNMISMSILIKQAPPAEEAELSARLMRYSRLAMILTFRALQPGAETDTLESLLIRPADNRTMSAQSDTSERQMSSFAHSVDGGSNNNGNAVSSALPPAEQQELMTEDERQWLLAATPGTRPLMVVSWLEGYFDSLHAAGYQSNELALTGIMVNLFSVRGGIGATLGAIGAQLPYPYVHLVYWTIQVVLVALSIETGVILAADTYFKNNGQGDYSPVDDSPNVWPQDSNLWYFNKFMQITVSNVIFALFTEGLLKVCDKLSNPCSLEETSFSERVYGTFMFNNCRALRAGHISYAHMKSKND